LVVNSYPKERKENPLPAISLLWQPHGQVDFRTAGHGRIAFILVISLDLCFDGQIFKMLITCVSLDKFNDLIRPFRTSFAARHCHSDTILLLGY